MKNALNLQNTFLKLFNDFISKNKKITLGVLEASKVNPKANKDKYQDYDTSLFSPLISMYEFLEINKKGQY